ncbi:MAG: right-handed parallel beta-helix repeat-containing protein [Kiritimatiellae bacterium]|nr:right-handed parallel beta-helix repeat-containing protein [Kiritimatiellia bacterium]
MKHIPFLVLGVLLLGGILNAARGDSGVVTFADGKTPTREIHVSPSGSDGAGDGSAGNPYATIAYAVSQAATGTAVRVHPGTYAGGQYMANVAGTAEYPVWISGTDPVSRPLLSGSAQGIHFVKVRYLVVENLEVSGASGNGLNCDDGGDYADALAAHHVVFRNLDIHDIGGTGNQDGLKLSGLNDFWVLDSRFARCGGASSGSGIDHVGCHRGLIVGCTFQEMSGNAVQCKGGSEDIEIRGCRMLDAGARGVNMGGSTGFEFFRPPLSTNEPNVEARDIRVLANLFKGSGAPVAFVGCVDSIAANNTIIDPDTWVARILQETTTSGDYAFRACADSVFANNLVYYNRATLSTHVNVGPDTDPGSFTFAHNLWYAHDNPANSAPSLPVTETGGIVGQNPDVLDAGADDYRIDTNSPAAGQGTVLTNVPFDFAGNPYADPPAIGAFEVDAAPAPPAELDVAP